MFRETRKTTQTSPNHLEQHNKLLEVACQDTFI